MNPPPPASHGVLLLSCPDTAGIVHDISGLLLEHTCTILQSQQFGSPSSGRFFMRVEFARADGGDVVLGPLRDGMDVLAARYGMTWELVDRAYRLRVVIMVSRSAHCLNDLLFRVSVGELGVDVVAVVSNHPDLAPLAASHEVPFHHIPVTPATKPDAEAALLDLLHTEHVDLVVLARYMQILSPDLCTHLAARAINIHHSMLPSFTGARPYHQAYARGVKLVGATAHYVTADLDEGPIIEQELVRVDHSLEPDQLAARGREAECRALARAVRWHSESRVVVVDRRTIVFP